jgi:glycosyltransferase involved in cell wall biosynthesis
VTLPKVSILIPVFNREKIISKTIESALNQTYDNIEVIIVDNVSEDSTYSIVQAYADKDMRVKAFQNDDNIGPVKNWLKCVEYSNGEYIKFLWSDDLIAENFIEKTIKYLENYDDVGFAYSPVLLIDENDNHLKYMYKLFHQDKVVTSDEFIKSSILGGPVPVSPGCALFRREDIIKHLKVEIPNQDKLIFNRYGAGNDLLIFLLTAMNYEKVAFVSETLSYFRSHKGSFTITNDLSLYYSWAKLYFLKKHNKRTLMKIFKTQLICKSLINSKYRKMNKSIKITPSLLYVFIYTLKYIGKKILKHHYQK